MKAILHAKQKSKEADSMQKIHLKWEQHLNCNSVKVTHS